VLGVLSCNHFAILYEKEGFFFEKSTLSVPPRNRVGDYVHCLCRVLNVIMKRLLAEFDPRAAGPLKEIIHHVSLEAQGLPMPERIAPRKTKLGTLDLTASTLFINNIAMHARVGQCARAINKNFLFRHGSGVVRSGYCASVITGAGHI
jgi:hypothetical protein